MSPDAAPARLCVTNVDVRDVFFETAASLTRRVGYAEVPA